MTVFTPDSNISWSEARQLLYAKVTNLLRATQFCLDADLWEPALILIYSGIDAMAWLNRPATQTESSRSDFVQWAEKYLESGVCFHVSGDELYAARCALLHSMTDTARANRQHGVGRLAYHRHGDGIPGLCVPKPVGPVSADELGTDIAIDELIEAFQSGTKIFLGELEDDDKRREIVHHRVAHFYFRRVHWIV